MKRKSAMTGEFIITQENDNSIHVFQIFDKAMPELKKICKKNNIVYPASANTQALGRLIVKTLGDGEYAEVGDYMVRRLPDKNKTGSRPVEIARNYGKGRVTAALKEIAEKVCMKYSDKWNTHTLGSKLIDFIETGKQPEIS